jgi:hypothetical protein
MIGKFFVPANAGGGGTYSTVLREYTSSGTWNKPAGLLFIEVICMGGGGGGASGSRTLSGAISRGGCGGGNGGISYGTFDASELGTIESYTVGAAGTGGAAVTVNSTNGNPGGNGGPTSFGTTAKISAVGGIRGQFNTASTFQLSSTRYTDVNYPVIAGSISNASGGLGGSATSQNTGNVTFSQIMNSGSGGGVNTSNIASNGGAGAQYWPRTGVFTPNPAPAAGVANGGNGANGGDDVGSRLSSSNTTVLAGQSYFAGGGAAGGAGHPSGVGGNGGNGGRCGGGGGGGGGSRNGFNSGAGGAGGIGALVIVEHIVS